MAHDLLEIMSTTALCFPRDHCLEFSYLTIPPQTHATMRPTREVRLQHIPALTRLSITVAFLAWLKLSIYMAIVSVAIVLSFHLNNKPSALGSSTRACSVTNTNMKQRRNMHFPWDSSSGSCRWRASYRGYSTISIQSHGIVKDRRWYRLVGRLSLFLQWYLPRLSQLVFFFSQLMQRKVEADDLLVIRSMSICYHIRRASPTSCCAC
jgi:hypothetical protein